MEKLKRILQWWFEYVPVPFKERHIDEELLTTNLIPVLVGARRSGKSTLLFQFITKLKKTIPKKNIIYINYEDDRLLPLEGTELSDLISCIRQFFNPDPDFPIYLFLDEIQNVPNWEHTVRRIYETEKNVKLFLTGSNSSLLSTDIATALRGRTLTVTIRPLSFDECIVFSGKKIPKAESYRYTSQKDEYLSLFTEYLIYGGFPEVVNESRSSIKQAILQEYYHTLFFADIVERYQIRNVKALDAFIRILTRQMSALFSLGKMTDTLRSLGFKTTKATLSEYLGFIESAFFGKSVSIYSHSIKDQLQYPRKFYLIDNGLYTASAFIKNSDMGRLLENLFYNHLVRLTPTIAYWKDKAGYEVDFVLPEFFDKASQCALYQVCFNPENPETRKREVRALLRAADEFNLDKGIIITRDTWASFQEQDIEIVMIPFIQWMTGTQERENVRT